MEKYREKYAYSHHPELTIIKCWLNKKIPVEDKAVSDFHPQHHYFLVLPKGQHSHEFGVFASKSTFYSYIEIIYTSTCFRA